MLHSPTSITGSNRRVSYFILSKSPRDRDNSIASRHSSVDNDKGEKSGELFKSNTNTESIINLLEEPGIKTE